MDQTEVSAWATPEQMLAPTQNTESDAGASPRLLIELSLSHREKRELCHPLKTSGSRKSTLASALAVRACNGHNRRVAIVDLDAQQTLAQWFATRTVKDAPEVFSGELSPREACEKLRLDGWDIVFLDGPPSFLELIGEAIREADIVVIPIKPSIPDLRSTQDAVALVNEAAKPMLVVINDATAIDKTVVTTRDVLMKGVGEDQVAKTVVHHRVSHMHGFAAGKSAAEVNRGRDKKAVEEIDALWREVAARIGVAP